MAERETTARVPSPGIRFVPFEQMQSTINPHPAELQAEQEEADELAERIESLTERLQAFLAGASTTREIVP